MMSYYNRKGQGSKEKECLGKEEMTKQCYYDEDKAPED